MPSKTSSGVRDEIYALYGGLNGSISSRSPAITIHPMEFAGAEGDPQQNFLG
jgi:hypothetical protein